MFRLRTVVYLVACSSVVTGPSLVADVRTSEKTLVRFEGGVGRVINFFAGKAAKDGMTATVAVSGDRKATFGDNNGTIVDLEEEKIYELDMKKKQYHVTTFAEMRRRLEEARSSAEAQARKAEDAPGPASPDADQPDAEQAPEVEVDVNVKETGQRKAINGFDTKQYVLTIALHEKGKTLEQSGGLLLVSDMWMTPTVAALKELTDFELRYLQQLQGPEAFGASIEQMQAVIAAHPQLKEGLARMGEESRKLDGTAILTTVTAEVAKSAEQLAAEKPSAPAEEEAPAPTNVSSLLGGLGRRMAQRKSEPQDAAPKSRVVLLSITHERLSIATQVSAADVAMPAGFREDR